MENRKMVPEIRFSGFTDPWEQRKAIDIADYLKGNGYSKGDLTEAGTPIILYGRLYTNYQFAISEVDTFAVPRNGAVYSQGNEVIVPASGETAEDIARASAVEKSGVLLGGALNILRPFDFMDPLFLALAISNGEPQKELAKKAQGKSVVHIHNSDIQEVTIAYPSRTEQDRIGSVFRLLDHRITLHQRKLEKLKTFKKAMLDKMFPKNGELVPEIRFSGFTDPWEQCKLGDIGKASGGISIESEFDEFGKYKVISIGSYSVTNKYIDQGIRVNKTEKTENYILNKNDLTMILNDKTASGNIIGRVLLIDTDDSYVFNQRTERIEVNEDEYLPEFLYQLLNADNTRAKIILASQGNTQIYVNWRTISKLAYKITMSKDEQSKIAKIFTNVDNIITLHQRKLEKLQNIKKSMLNKMFI